MADVHSKETRSLNMSRIKGKNTKPELVVRKFLFASGLRYRLHVKDLPGKPDLIFPKYKKAHPGMEHKDCFKNVVAQWKYNDNNPNKKSQS